jgi:hypothetical protein
LDERLEEYELERRLVVRSLSFTRECDVLSGEEGGVLCVLCAEGRGARLGTSGFFVFFEDPKKEGSMRTNCGRIASDGVTDFVGCSTVWLSGR